MMNFLQMLDERKRIEQMYQMKAMQQMAGQHLLPVGIQDPMAAMMSQGPQPGYGVIAPEAMTVPATAGTPGYGVLAPESMTPANVAAASGAPGMGAGLMAGLPALLGLASMFAGGDSGGSAPASAPPPSQPVGTSKDGLPYLRTNDAVWRKRRRGLLEY